jgi:hypothetical protein
MPFCRFIHINSENGFAGPDLCGLDTGLVFIHSALFAEIAVPDGKGQVVPVQKCPAFNFKGGPAHIPAVIGMNKKDVFVGFDHLHALFKGSPPFLAFIARVVMVLTPPMAFQEGPDVKDHILGRYESGIQHFQF